MKECRALTDQPGLPLTTGEGNTAGDSGLWSSDNPLAPRIITLRRERDEAEAECSQLREQLDAALGLLREALPSLGMNGRSYAQEALREACVLLGESPEAWTGSNSAYSQMAAEVGRLREQLDAARQALVERPGALGRCNPTGFNPTASSATWCHCCGAPQGWKPDRG